MFLTFTAIFFLGRSEMELKQSCNVFLPGRQYQEIKDLSYRLNIPYSELIREGVSLVLRKYRKKDDCKVESNCDEN